MSEIKRELRPKNLHKDALLIDELKKSNHK